MFCDCYDDVQESYNYDEIEEFAPMFRDIEKMIDVSEKGSLQPRTLNYLWAIKLQTRGFYL